MESLVSFVANKLGEFILNEAKLLGGVGDKVILVERELKRIQCCLMDADSKRRKGNAQVENWLNELREVAYRIEDAIDTFYLQLEDNHLQVEDNNNHARQKKCCCFQYFGTLKNLGQKALKVPGLHNFAIELGDIQKELEDIFKSKDKYGIKPLEDIAGRREPVMMPHRRAAYEDVNETEVVGLDADKNNILKLLFSHEETPRRAVISILGPGGIGKTTLAQIVYKRSTTSEDRFKYHIMLSVSQNYSLIDLLRKMLKHSEPKNQDVGDLVEDLKSVLNEKTRYLIILDDVWEVDLWEKLQHVLPDHNNGSRVLMTTRDKKVATSADPMKPYYLHLLDDNQSQDLLLKKALPYQNCPNDLRDIADEISRKCQGLPLALIVVGGILKTKINKTRKEWDTVLRNMNWHSDGKGCMDVLAMSYEEMPYYLKACFLYVASFPEDYEISAKRLIRMWVAEGLIPLEDKKSMEETAKDYLDQLFQRSMIQVSSLHSDGSLKYCRVHDLLRDFAMHEAGKENFITIFPKTEGINHPDRVTRRVSLQSDCSEFEKYIGPKTRSLWLHQRNNPLNNFRINCNIFKLLRVLEIVGVSEIELMGINGLIHLKYLGIRNCGRLKLPNVCSLGRLKNLETLDLRSTLIENGPPTDLWAIGTLRHVMWDAMSDSPYSGPPSNAEPRNLRTLQWISAVETWHENQLPRLTKLQKLGLDNGCINKPKKINWDVAVHLLKTLPVLRSLGIRGWDIPDEIVYPKIIPNYEDLETLYLEGRWSRNVTLEASLFPPYLVKLTLITPLFEEDPMPQLGKLTSLKKLRLEGSVYCKGEEMICPSGFPVLETLHLALYRIKSFTVMEGVMPNLKHLKNSGSTVLIMPPKLSQFSMYSYL